MGKPMKMQNAWGEELESSTLLQVEKEQQEGRNKTPQKMIIE